MVRNVCSRRCRADGGGDAAEIVTRVLADVRTFTAGAKQSDDITILAARVRADEELMCVDNPGMPAVRAMKVPRPPRRWIHQNHLVHGFTSSPLAKSRRTARRSRRVWQEYRSRHRSRGT